MHLSILSIHLFWYLYLSIYLVRWIALCLLCYKDNFLLLNNKPWTIRVWPIQSLIPQWLLNYWKLFKAKYQQDLVSWNGTFCLLVWMRDSLPGGNLTACTTDLLLQHSAWLWRVERCHGEVYSSDACQSSPNNAAKRPYPYPVDISRDIMCMDDCPKTTHYNTFSRQIINTYAVY